MRRFTYPRSMEEIEKRTLAFKDKSVFGDFTQTCWKHLRDEISSVEELRSRMCNRCDFTYGSKNPAHISMVTELYTRRCLGFSGERLWQKKI